MFLNCPKCKSRYEVDGESIPLSGTYAHCANCENIFFVKKKASQLDDEGAATQAGLEEELELGKTETEPEDREKTSEQELKDAEGDEEPPEPEPSASPIPAVEESGRQVDAERFVDAGGFEPSESLVEPIDDSALTEAAEPAISFLEDSHPSTMLDSDSLGSITEETVLAEESEVDESEEFSGAEEQVFAVSEEASAPETESGKDHAENAEGNLEEGMQEISSDEENLFFVDESEVEISDEIPEIFEDSGFEEDNERAVFEHEDGSSFSGEPSDSDAGDKHQRDVDSILAGLNNSADGEIEPDSSQEEDDIAAIFRQVEAGGYPIEDDSILQEESAESEEEETSEKEVPDMSEGDADVASASSEEDDLEESLSALGVSSIDQTDIESIFSEIQSEGDLLPGSDSDIKELNEESELIPEDSPQNEVDALFEDISKSQTGSTDEKPEPLAEAGSDLDSAIETAFNSAGIGDEKSGNEVSADSEGLGDLDIPTEEDLEETLDFVIESGMKESPEPEGELTGKVSGSPDEGSDGSDLDSIFDQLDDTVISDDFSKEITEEDIGGISDIPEEMEPVLPLSEEGAETPDDKILEGDSGIGSESNGEGPKAEASSSSNMEKTGEVFAAGDDEIDDIIFEATSSFKKEDIQDLEEEESSVSEEELSEQAEIVPDELVEVSQGESGESEIDEILKSATEIEEAPQESKDLVEEIVQSVEMSEGQEAGIAEPAEDTIMELDDLSFEEGPTMPDVQSQLTPENILEETSEDMLLEAGQEAKDTAPKGVQEEVDSMLSKIREKKDDFSGITTDDAISEILEQAGVGDQGDSADIDSIFDSVSEAEEEKAGEPEPATDVEEVISSDQNGAKESAVPSSFGQEDIDAIFAASGSSAEESEEAVTSSADFISDGDLEAAINSEIVDIETSELTREITESMGESSVDDDINSLISEVVGEIEAENVASESDVNEIVASIEAEPEPPAPPEPVSAAPEVVGSQDDIDAIFAAAGAGAEPEPEPPAPLEPVSAAPEVVGSQDDIDAIFAAAGAGAEPEPEPPAPPEPVSAAPEVVGSQDDIDAIFAAAGAGAEPEPEPPAPLEPVSAAPEVVGSQDDIDAIFAAAGAGAEPEPEPPAPPEPVSAAPEVVGSQDDIDAIFAAAGAGAEPEPEPPAPPEPVSAAPEVVGSQDDIDAIFAAAGAGAEPEPEPPAPPEPVSAAPEVVGSQDDIDAIFASAGAGAEPEPEPPASPEPVSTTPEVVGSQDDIDAIFASAGAGAEPEPEPPAPPEPVSATPEVVGSQDDIDAIFASAGAGGEPEPEPVADVSVGEDAIPDAIGGTGLVSQDDIDALFVDGDEDEEASLPEPVSATPEVASEDAIPEATGGTGQVSQDDIDALFAEGGGEEEDSSLQDELDSILEGSESSEVAEGESSEEDIDSLMADSGGEAEEEPDLAELSAGGVDDTGDDIDSLLGEAEASGGDDGLVSQDDLDALFASEGDESGAGDEPDLFGGESDSDLESLLGSDDSESSSSDEMPEETEGIDTSMLEELEAVESDSAGETEPSDSFDDEEEDSEPEEVEGKKKKILPKVGKKAAMAAAAVIVLAVGGGIFFFKDNIPFVAGLIESLSTEEAVVAEKTSEPLEEPMKDELVEEAVSEAPAEFDDGSGDEFEEETIETARTEPVIKSDKSSAKPEEAPAVVADSSQADIAEEEKFDPTAEFEVEPVDEGDFAEDSELKFGIIVPVDFNAQAVKVMTADVLIRFSTGRGRNTAEGKKFFYEMAIEDEIEKFFLSKFYEDTHYVQDKIVAELNAKFKKRRDMEVISEIDIENFKLR